MSTVPNITLNDGVQIPQLGFGVFQIDPADTVDVTLTALRAGYRHIDTAQMYGNEAQVGEALRHFGGDSSEVFVTSKLNNSHHGRDDALASFDDFRSAQEIHDAITARGDRVGRATVYRALRTLAQQPDVDVIIRGDGEAVYRRCSAGHHHHLICRRCGRTVEVGELPVVDWAEQLATEHGFTEVEHVGQLTLPHTLPTHHRGLAHPGKLTIAIAVNGWVGLRAGRTERWWGHTTNAALIYCVHV